MAYGKIKHIRLRKRMIEVLKSTEGDELPSAQALMEMVINSGMSQNLVGSNNRIAQLCRTTKGISSVTQKISGGGGDSYTAEVYYLESEEAFNEWVTSKMG
tara:strand:- start:826 stop:1128 length:303 start_codon:yes stop_codon:yes gene_type:complete